MSFSVENFLSLADLGEKVRKLRKAELVEIANFFEIDTDPNMKKVEIKSIVEKILIENNLLETATVSEGDGQNNTQLTLELKKLEIQERQQERQIQLELEKEKLKMQERIELERLKLQGNGSQQSNASSFHAAQNVRLVPSFCEKTVDKYFPHFEKIAANLNWPYAYWPTLLQTVLVGRAAEVYSALSLEDAADYKTIKNAILNAYELVPETYRQKFRKYSKFERQTYVEFAREKEDLFDRWVRAKNVNNDYNSLRQLILIEEFKQCAPQEIQMRVDEREIKTVKEAAIMADTYNLTHRCWERNKITKNQSNLRTEEKMLTEPRVPNVFNKNYNQRVPPAPVPRENKIFCSYCKKDNHFISECRILKRKREENKFQPHAFITHKTRNDSIYQSSSPKLGRSEKEKNSYMKRYEPFLSQGYVYINDPEEAKPIKILRGYWRVANFNIRRRASIIEIYLHRRYCIITRGRNDYK